jgi:hypothetical protein
MATDWLPKYQPLFGTPEKATEAFPSLGGTEGWASWRWDPARPNWYYSQTPEWAQGMADQTQAATPGADMQQKSLDMMDYLKAIAEGKQSASLEQGARMEQAARGAAKGQLAAGPWSTAAQRASGYAAGQAGMDIGAQAQVAAQQERQAAQAAYLEAAEAQRKQDVSAQLALEDLAQKYRDMGMTDDQARAAAMRQYVKDMVARYGLQMQGQSMWDEKNQGKQAAMFGMMGSIGGAAIGGMAGGPGGAALGSSVGGSLGKAAGEA